MEQEWFKVEALQDYSEEDASPSLNTWQRGDRETSIQLMPQYAEAWVALCGQSPAHKRRFHIVDKPYTSYLQWELELYKHVNIPLAREEVYLVPRKDIAQLKLPVGDIMIFDQKRVVQNHYTPEGQLTTMDFYEAGQDNIDTFLQLREELPKYAMPVATRHKGN